jgi:hypothetical protein
MLRKDEGHFYAGVLQLSVRFGQGIVDDAWWIAEEDSPGRGATLEAKKAPRPLEGLGGGDGHEAEVPGGEPLAYAAFPSRRHLGEVDVEKVRDARPEGRFFTVIHRSQFATSSSYCAVQPPSTSNVDPVTKLEAREARNTAGPTISHTSPNRPCGTLLTTSSYHVSSSMICLTRGVVK